MKAIFYILLIAFSFTSCKNTPSSQGIVIATNAWTAAYALAAGATSVSVLAPYEMVHPSEYELRPGDIVRLANAEIIVYAGYEVMVNQIKTGLEIEDDQLLMIATSYNYNEIEESVMRIAKRIGTEDIAVENLQEIRQVMENGRDELMDIGLNRTSAIVHFFQKSFSDEMGIAATGIFGPAPPEPRQILTLTKTGAELIIDNAHNPVGGTMKEILKDAGYVLLLNFPGMYETKTLTDVIEYNIEQLMGALQELNR